MGISLKPRYLRRYRDIALLLLKYGRGSFIDSSVLEEPLGGESLGRESARESQSTGSKLAAELPTDLERLGPTFVKVGQLLSSRADLLPPAYIESLSRLQDSVQPFPFQDVEKIVSRELGVRLSKAFDFFEPEPLAAASLGQVHRAALRGGRKVAVKVQRPGIHGGIINDFEAIEPVAELLDRHTEIGRRYRFGEMTREFRLAILRELDYLQEARNLELLAENLSSFDRIVVPMPIPDYSTSHVLTMDYLPGIKITALHPVVRTDVPGSELAEQLFQAYLKQVLVDGFFHADPHPGNVSLLPDGRLCLLDLGMVAWVPRSIQNDLLQLMLALSEGREEEVGRLVLKLGEQGTAVDTRELTRRVGSLMARYKDTSIGSIPMGGLVLEVMRDAGDCGVRLPSELSMLGKTLLNLEQIGQALDPTFDPTASIRRNFSRIARQKVVQAMSPSHLYGALMDVKNLGLSLPRRLSAILKAAAHNEFEIRVRAIDENRVLAGLQKIANRITLGLVLAALIIGAAMLMRVQTQFTLFGYPGLAMILFMAATVAGLTLTLVVFFSDDR